MKTPTQIRRLAPVKRYHEAQAAMDEARRLVGVYATVAAEAVVELRERMPAQQVADELGVSRTTVYRLLED